MKLVFFLLPLFTFLAAVPAYAAGDESAYDRVIKSGTIRCGYAISPPVMVRDPNTGALSGLDYDLWQEIGRELDLKIEYVEEAGWGNFIEGLNSGRYDAFCSEIWADSARTKHLSLSIPVLYSFLNAYVRADDHRFDGDLEKINAAGAVIPVIEGDVSVAMAQGRFPQAKLLSLPQTATISEMFMAVKSGKADVLFFDQAMADGLTKNNPGVLRKLENVDSPFVFASYFSVRSGELRLRDMLNVALRKMIDDGRIETMAKTYSADYKAPGRNY